MWSYANAGLSHRTPLQNQELQSSNCGRCRKPSCTRLQAERYGWKTDTVNPERWRISVLTGKAWPSSRTERTTAARSLARQYRATVVVKGAEDFISDGTRTIIDHAGSPYMTKGGYGDLLAGVAGALLARGHTPFESAKAAAFIVGRAGEIASKKLGESMLASDVLEILPVVIHRTQH